MYGKLFESMYDGSLREDWKARIVFMDMIILCDPDGVVDMTPEALSARTGVPLEIVTYGISALEKPDPISRSQKEDGRRIVRLDEHREWGWHIVNHEYYRDLVDADDKRKKARDRKRRSRENQKRQESEKDTSQIVTPGHTESHKSRHTDTNADEDENKRRAAPPLKGGGAGAFHGRSQDSDEIERCRQLARTHKLALRKSDDEVLKIVQEVRPETTREELPELLQSSDPSGQARDSRKSGT